MDSRQLVRCRVPLHQSLPTRVQAGDGHQAQRAGLHPGRTARSPRRSRAGAAWVKRPGLWTTPANWLRAGQCSSELTTGSRSTRISPKNSFASRARAAWIAVSPSVRPDAQLTISFLTGTITSSAETGKKQCANCTRTITSRSSLDEFVQLDVKLLVYWGSPRPQSPS